MPIEKTNLDLKFNSGNNFMIEGTVAGEYISLGKIEGGRLLPTQGEVTASFGDGTKFIGPGATECRFEIILSQVTTEIINTINQIAGKIKFAYYDNGLDISGDRHHLYFPELMIKNQFVLDMKGEQQQTIALEGSLAPQDGDAECIPDDDLPDGVNVTGAEAVTSYNPYYVSLQEAAEAEAEPEP